MNNSLKLVIFIAFFSTLSTVTHGWSDDEEERELNNLIQSFEKSINIDSNINEINRTFYKIVKVEDGELEGHAEPEIVPMIDSLLRNFVDLERKLSDFYQRFKHLEDKLMLKSIMRKFKCIQYESKILSLNETMQLVKFELEPLKNLNMVIGLIHIDAYILNQKLFKLKEEFGSYNEIDNIQKELQTLEQMMKNFDDKNPSARKELIESIRESFKHSDIIAEKLRKIRSDSITESNLHSKFIPVKNDYNLSYLIQMHENVHNLKEIYEKKIEAGESLTSSSSTIGLGNLLIIFSIIFLISFQNY